MQGTPPEVSKAVQAAELAAADGEDPLDAFMAQEILPEVKQKEQQEAARKEEERKALAQQLAVGRPSLLDTTALPSGFSAGLDWSLQAAVVVTSHRTA